VVDFETHGLSRREFVTANFEEVPFHALFVNKGKKRAARWR
jgi:hypothetical protein